MIGSETDVFMHYKNVEYLIQLISLIQYKGIKNKIVLVTKNAVPVEFINFVIKNSLQDKITFYFSYSGLPKEIEPAVDQDKLKESMAEVFSNNLKVVHYWRPLLPQNTTVEKIKEISDFVAKNAQCSVVLGLKYNHQIIENMKPYWDDLSNTHNIPNIGQIYPNGSKQYIYHYIKNQYPDYPVFETNSCALSFVNNQPDFNGFFQTENCKNNLCPDSQRAKCEKVFQIPDTDKIIKAFDRVGIRSSYKLENNELFVDTDLEHGQLIFLRQILNFPIRSKKMSSANEWSGVAANSRDAYLVDFRISDLIKISLDIKNSFRQIEKQTWHKKEFSKELLVQLGHLSDILLKQTHKLNTLNKLENLEKIGDEIADIILNVISIWDECRNTDNFNDCDFKTINHLMQAKYKEFSVEQCFNELVAKCLEIYTQINIKEEETNLNDILRDLLSLAMLLSYFTQSDIGSAYLKMKKDSKIFINKNLNFQL